MAGKNKKILLAFGSVSERLLLIEIISQFERTIQIDFVTNEEETLRYLARHALKRLPGLILFVAPPLRKDIAQVIDTIRRDPVSAGIPIAFFLFPSEVEVMKVWIPANGVYFYPRQSKPSEIKFYVRQMMQRYVETHSLKES